MLKRFENPSFRQPVVLSSPCSRALLYPQWRIQGRGPGASPPPPLNFRPNGGAKGGKNFLGETGSPLICLDPALTLLDFGVVMKDST